MRFEFNGYAGKVSEIDLTQHKLNQNPLESNFATKFIGRKGLAARWLFDSLFKEIDPPILWAEIIHIALRYIGLLVYT